MNPVLEVVREDLTILTRDRPALFWTVGWPVVFALFFGFLMSGGGPGTRPHEHRHRGRSRNLGAVGGITWACLRVFAMLGGGMIPLIANPEWMQRASAVSPLRWSVLAIGVLTFALGARAFRRAEV
jgi:hypothetical protein